MGELANPSERRVAKSNSKPPAFSLSKKDVKVFVNFIFNFFVLKRDADETDLLRKDAEKN